MSKKFEELTIKDNFMFGAVMKNSEKCKAVLECILNIKIRKIEYPELEKTINNTYKSKGIRLDVYVEDEKNTIYNIEMQATDKKNLPKRTRYYQDMFVHILSSSFNSPSFLHIFHYGFSIINCCPVVGRKKLTYNTYN